MKQEFKNLALRADQVNYSSDSPKRIYLNSEEEIRKAEERGFAVLYDEVEHPDGNIITRFFLVVDFDSLLNALDRL